MPPGARDILLERDPNLISIVFNNEYDFEMTGLQSDGNLIYGFSLGMKMIKPSLVCIYWKDMGSVRTKQLNLFCSSARKQMSWDKT